MRGSCAPYIVYECRENFRESLTTPMGTFPQILMGFCWIVMDPVNVPPRFEVRIFTRSQDNNDWNFGWGHHGGCEP